MPQAPQSAEMELLAAAGLLGNSPTLEAIIRMHQQRMQMQGIQPQYPALGESLGGDLKEVKRIPK